MSNTPLTKRQIIAICQLAGKAYKVMSPGLGDMTQEDFRHGEIFNVTGFDSIKSCTQRHYIPLYNHFVQLAGLPPKSDSTWSDADKAIHILRDTMARHELDLTYLTVIAGSKFPILRGIGPAAIIDNIRRRLTRDDIMQLVYTLTNRGRAKTAQIDAKLNLDPTDRYEPHADPSTRPPGRLGDYFGTTPAPPPDHDPS